MRITKQLVPTDIAFRTLFVTDVDLDSRVS